MGKWWQNDMVDASQGSYSDPNMALQIASSPSQLYTAPDQADDEKEARESKGGFLKSFLSLAGKADGALSNMFGGVYSSAKEDLATGAQAFMYPVDKLASGAHWLYSEGVSQPLSTAIIQAGKAQTSGDYGQLFEPQEWSEAYGKAETTSPGQALTNVALTQTSQGTIPMTNIQVEDRQQTEQQKRQAERFIYDTDYWRDKVGWTYTAGTGATDFALVLAADPSTYLLAGAGSVVKGARSIQIATTKGGELVRTQGAVTDVAKKLVGKKPQTLEEVSNGKKMTEFFDWTNKASATGAARKTAEEIAQHPIWGRGRRTNPFAQQYSDVLARTPRDEMPMMYRYFAGSTADVGALSASGSQTLSNIGKLSENRALVDSVKFDPAILAFYAEREGATLKVPGVVQTPPLAVSPTTEGLYADAAKSIMASNPGLKINAAGKVSKRAVANAQAWKSAKVDLMQGELDAMAQKSQYLRDILGDNMGKAANEFSPAGANLFGNMERAYRAGGGSFTSSGKAADLKYNRAMTDRKARFTSDGIREGFFGTPVRIVQAFGDRTPVGRVNHNDADAGDRVLDMLKQVPGLGKDTRMSLFNEYMRAGDKVGKSRALDSIHTSVINHLANRSGLDPQVAAVIGDMTKVGIAKTMDDLMGVAGKGGISRPQAFTSATEGGVEGATRLDVASRYMEDGVAYKFAPLAKTQLQQTDTLMPIKDMVRVFERNAGSIQAVRKAGGTALDASRVAVDNFNTLWKASTLLRPAYMPRMISEEAMLSGIKFGFMSRLVADPAIGAKNFVLNRGQYLNAEIGRGSYTPSTGKGMDSSLAIVKIGDEEVIQSVKARRAALEAEIQTAGTGIEDIAQLGKLKGELMAAKKPALKAELKERIAKYKDPAEVARLKGELEVTKVKRVRVNKALPVVRARIQMEKELHSGLEGDLAKFTKRHEALQQKVATAGTTASNKQLMKLDALELKIDDITSRMDDHRVVMDEFTDYANEIYRTAIKSTGRRMGEGTFEAHGYKIPQAFSEAWENSIPRDQVSSENAYTAMYARGEAVDAARAIKTGGWTVITPDQPHHMSEWTHALNRQFGQDEVFQLVAKDSTGRAARDWLATAEGKQHLDDLGIAGRDPDKLVDDIGLTLDKYLPEDTGLRQKMIDGDEITSADLSRAIAKEDFPAVHGQEVKASLGLWAKDTGGNMLDRMIEKGFKRLGTIPSDVMSRQPVYLRFQEMQYKRLLGQEIAYRKSIGKSEAIEPATFQKILESSDRLARKDISQIVYDPTRTSASEAVRFLSPFFSAHADGLARWGGMIAEQPEMLGKMAKIYNAPVAANMVTDSQGNLVNEDGQATIHDPVTGEFIEKKFVPITERVLHFKAPWAGKGSGDIPIKLQAMNTILPGDPWFNPGSGPIVQVAGSQIAKKYPTAGEFLTWAKILPYGPSGSAVDAVTPKYMRAMYEAWRGDDPNNEAYQKAYLAVYNKKVAEFNDPNSDFHEKPFKISDIEKEAQQFLNLEILEAWGSPAQTSSTPLTGTKYQFFVDQYSQMRKMDPENARDKFMDKFGTEYMGFTASLSKSMGIAATVSADQQAEKYADDIKADPDMAQFWVGDVYNGGPFSSSVYQKQMDQHFGSARAREKIPADEAITKSQESAGWTTYVKAKTQLDAALIRAGFKSYSQKGAEGFLQTKQQMTSVISERFPAWSEAFNTLDRGKVPNRIKSFEKAIQDTRLMSDPMRQEMQPLAQYILARRQLKQVLDSRGVKQLSFDVGGNPTGENADVGHAWNQVVMGLVNSNTAFGDLYNRYLTNDNLQ